MIKKNSLKANLGMLGFFPFLILFLFTFSACKVNGNPADIGWNDMVAPYRHMVDMDGYRMSVIDMGKGEPVIMIHGFADSTYCWHNNAKALNDAGFRTILIDYPGFGQSTIPPDDFIFSVENLGKEIIALADKLKLEKFSVIGSSMGGGISLYLAGNYPHRIIKAVPIDPACYTMKPPPLLALLSDDNFGYQAEPFISKATVKVALRQCYRDKSKVTNTFVDEYARPLSKPGYIRAMIRLLREYESPKAHSMIQKYDEISRPVMIIWGDKDQWVPPKFGPRLNKDIPGSKLYMIKNAGHLPHQEQPEVVNPIFIKFLKSGDDTAEK